LTRYEKSNKKEFQKIFQLRRKISILFQERKRIDSLKQFEKKMLLAGFHKVAGIDEAGRGALAGPIVASAVIFQQIESLFVDHLKDSKKLTKQKREYLYSIIQTSSYDIGIGIVSPEIIDKINIAQATFLAMKRAVMNLRECPEYILVDGFKIPNIHLPQQHLIKGESRSISIAAASIVAKVYRDKLMNQLHKEYPFYQFDQNVGYGTKRHILAIKKFGICPLHRKTFKGVIENHINKPRIISKSLFE